MLDDNICQSSVSGVERGGAARGGKLLYSRFLLKFSSITKELYWLNSVHI
jgi:hypothetical protein